MVSDFNDCISKSLPHKENEESNGKIGSSHKPHLQSYSPIMQRFVTAVEIQ